MHPRKIDPDYYNACTRPVKTASVNGKSPYTDHLGQRKNVALDPDEVRQIHQHAGPFRRLTDFIKLTNPSQSHKGCCLHGKCCAAKRQAREQAHQEKPQSPENPSADPKQTADNNAEATSQTADENVARQRKPRCTKAEKHRRLATLARFLEASASAEQIYDYAKTHWNIGKRSVQLYIRQIKKRWADEASREDYLAALWKSHKQHEAVLFKAFQL
ncbi:MAG: hypothetical protein NZM31_14525, partial [Gemmatales bacterium]|nr:hypothetical protein [Gemmatales bacterium]MDW8388211.1 hypothetical protein [Gemmatales bacterium]